ncbi:hypothetical protein PB2503_02442 [Parvularcula bermudensis HTCC2503]|uniref:OmpH family outer membrane protein n=1 Tax=Parvularcula bermudensis (strain ATCC BAA-594 / HTCC2503 / KCTC 12087) TaxID=314260 RepID=E0TCD2_PARBH|nr:OmpH family outer membrane protein [Parvularcula bermudensis]ADM08565.1 hypothetical protein PB2503_02442 [Parvularcula bermudensis HTCC2503]
MKKFIALIVVLGMLPGAAFAQKVAYYDHGKVVRDSNAWQSIDKELAAKRDEIVAKLQPIVAEVQKEGQELQKATDGLKPEQIQARYGERVQEYQGKLAGLQASRNQVNQQMSVVRELAENKINVVINDSLDEIASRRRVDVVERQVPLSFYSKKYDATDEVLAAVNQKLSSLDIDSLVAEVAARAEAQAQ